MALINSRGVGKYCWKYIKHTFRQHKTDVLWALRHTKIVEENRRALSLFVRQHHALCLKKHTCMFGTSSHSVNTTDQQTCILQKKTNNAPDAIRMKATLTGSVVAGIIKDLNMEELKSKVKQERMDNERNVHMTEKLKEIISEKCDNIIANLSEEDQRKLKIIQLEHNFMYSEGHLIPDSEEMSSENWLEALHAPSKAQRLKYYLFLSKRKYTKENARKRKEAVKENSRDGLRMNAYEHGKIFMRIYDSTIVKWQNYRLATAMQYGIPLVVDMDYASFMHPREVKNTAEQVLDLYCLNRGDDEMPFHIHMTDCSDDNPTYNLLKMRLQDADLMATVTSKNYLDLFDKDKLVYLSPNGRQVMREFDPTAVYIIGAFNDKAVQVPVSYARAKEQGIKCLRLPLDEYVTWNQGSKDLTLNQMMRIMRDMKNGKSWLEAFKALPSRKVRDFQRKR